MTTTIKLVLVALVLLGSASTALAQAPAPPRTGTMTLVPERAVPRAAPNAKLCSPAHPEGAELVRYPLASGPLTDAQIADLRLQPVRLRYAFESLNFYRDPKACGGGSWRLEVIPAGELVLVDPITKYVAYRVSCGNRLVWVGKPAPASPVMPLQPTFLDRKEVRGWWWGWWRDVIVEIDKPDGKPVDATIGSIRVVTEGSVAIRVYR